MGAVTIHGVGHVAIYSVEFNGNTATPPPRGTPKKVKRSNSSEPEKSLAFSNTYILRLSLLTALLTLDQQSQP